MAGDAPSFMRNIPDTEEGKDAIDVLADTPVETPAPATTETPTVTPPVTPPTEPKPGETTPTVETPAKTETPPVTPKPGEEPVYNAADILKKKPEERTQPEKDELAKHPEVLTEEQKKQLADEDAAAKANPPKQEDTTAKPPSSTDATKAAADALKNGDRSEQRKKLMETVDVLKKIPLITPNIPDPDNYWDDANKLFNMKAWATDFTRAFSLSIQQSLLGGQLGAAMFGILHDAMREEDDTRSGEMARQRENQTMLDRLASHAPVLAKDEKLQVRFERAIYGEKARRIAAAKAANKEPEPMKYEDYEAILDDLVTTTTTTVATPPVEPTVTPPGGPQMGGGDGAAVPEVDQDIAAMMGAKTKGQLF